MKQNGESWYLVLLVFLGMFALGILVLIFRNISLDTIDYKQKSTQLEGWRSLVRNPMQLFQRNEGDGEASERAVEVVGDAYVLSYGVNDGIEEQMVRGVILRWGKRMWR